MKKKIAIIGRGTAGSQAIIHFLRYMPECEIEWHFDPNIPVQSVGEGSALHLPKNLFNSLNFNYIDLGKIDATLKTGVYKSGWGNNMNDFLHQFPPPAISVHFNAVLLQDYIFGKVKNKVNLFYQNTNPENIDADYILDCSGKPSSYEDFHKSSYIPVNSAYITQCYWEYPRFNHTLTITRPYGWVFGIPLQNRCSIGYLFNRDINSLKDIKKDVESVFNEYNLTPSDSTTHLNFENYYRKQNYTERICYSGNSSFFLEPLEATSISAMNSIQRHCYDIWNNNHTVEQANLKYETIIEQLESIIMLHYFAGSKYNTRFWKFAKKMGEKCIKESLLHDEYFRKIINVSIRQKSSNLCIENNLEYGDGFWWLGSFLDNIEGLGIRDKLIEYI